MKLSRLEKIVFGGSLWGAAILILAAIQEPSLENFTLLVSILLSGLYTGLLFLTRKYWLKKLTGSPVVNAILIGSINAAIIETIFLFVEKAFGASGVAAHPNLLVDLLITLPWYIGMVWIFVLVQKKERFPLGVVLLLGAVYEMGADGILGGLIIPAMMGSPVNLINFLILSSLAAFWQFIPVYSSIVLPPAWVLDYGDPATPPNTKNWLRAFLPLLVLLPFTVYLLLLMVLLNSFGI